MDLLCIVRIPIQTLLTIGASALEVFTTGGALYLVVGSATDTRYIYD